MRLQNLPRLEDVCTRRWPVSQSLQSARNPPSHRGHCRSAQRSPWSEQTGQSWIKLFLNTWKLGNKAKTNSTANGPLDQTDNWPSILITIVSQFPIRKVILAEVSPGSRDGSLVKRRTRDRKVSGSSSGRSGGTVLFSRVNFLC